MMKTNLDVRIELNKSRSKSAFARYLNCTPAVIERRLNSMKQIDNLWQQYLEFRGSESEFVIYPRSSKK